MKVTLKTLQQKSFVVEIDDNETVLALKEKIQAEQGAGFPVEGLKLIYSGKILNDANKISEYKILESNFVVVMVTKGKPQPSKPQATPPTTSAATPSTTTPTPNTATASDTRPPTTDTKPQQETTPTTSGQQSSVVTPMEQSTSTPAATEPQGSMEAAASVLVTGSAYESAIEQLTNMGYTREQAMRAMQASYNNPDRAAEYLLEGKADQLIAEEESRQQEEIRRQQQELQQQQGQGGGVGSGGGQQEAVRGGEEGGEQQQQQVPPVIPGGGDPLAFISQTPQFQRLREQLQQNPAMLPHFLQQLSQQNPLLFQAIAQNQAEFLRMVNEGGQPGGAGGGPPGVPPGTVQIPVTPQEKEAIERLKELGFPEEDVIQAYFACDKNEELAANFLFHNNF